MRLGAVLERISRKNHRLLNVVKEKNYTRFAVVVSNDNEEFSGTLATVENEDYFVSYGTKIIIKVDDFYNYLWPLKEDESIDQTIIIINKKEEIQC